MWKQGGHQLRKHLSRRGTYSSPTDVAPSEREKEREEKHSSLSPFTGKLYLCHRFQAPQLSCIERQIPVLKVEG